MTEFTRPGRPASAPPAAELDRIDRALRPRSMRPLLLAALGDTATPAQCSVLDAKYAPGARATVLYRLGERLVTGDLDLEPSPGAGHGLGMRLSAFPDDPALPGLRVVADDPRELATLLAPALSDAGEGALLGCRTSLLRYRPRRRATFLLTAWLRANGTVGRAQYVAKVYHDPAKAAAVHAETAQLARDAEADGGLALAEPVAHVGALRLTLQRRVGGVPLDGLLAGAGRGVDLRPSLTRAAAALAMLHARTAVSTRTRSVDAELRRFAARAAALAPVDPVLAERLLCLVDRLTERAAQLPPPRAGLVHGDCKPSQFRLGPHGVALLDFDHCGLADPVSDLGTFLASLSKLAAQRPGRAAALSELGEAFATAYAGASRDPLAAEPEVVSWYEAVALVRKALRAFARAPRSSLASSLTDAARTCLTEHGGPRS